MTESLRGSLYALAAYSAWGAFPLFWKLLASVPALDVLSHRIVWSFVFLAILLTLRKSWLLVLNYFRDVRVLKFLLFSTLVIAVNWYLFIWAVNNGHVLDASLGYFINPLFNVVLGFVFLRERLRPLQMAAVGLAAVGVLYQIVYAGVFPWIALSLAGTFAAYGLLKKAAGVQAIPALAVETGLLVIPCLLHLQQNLIYTPDSAVNLTTWGLLVAGGVLTALPLLWFANAAQRLSLTTLGFFQYIAPSMQFLTAIILFNEAFTAQRAVAFVCIWAALIIFTLENVMYRRKRTSSSQIDSAPICRSNN